jgi:hypothetical protein
MSIGEGRLPFIFYRFFTLPLWVPIWLTLYLEYHPNVEYIFLLDAPFSVLSMVLANHGVRPSIAFGFLGILGTFWWYLLSLAIRRVVRFIMGHW